MEPVGVVAPDTVAVNVTACPNTDGFSDEMTAVVAIARQGVAWSDNLGAAGSWTWIGQMNRPTDNILISGAHKLSAVVGDRMYVLYGRQRATAINGRDDDAFLNRIPNITRPSATGGPRRARSDSRSARNGWVRNTRSTSRFPA